MPPSWRDEYLSSLREAEKNNPVNRDLVLACSQLNDRIAALEAEKAAWQASSPLTSTPTTKDTGAGGKAAATDADPGVARLRLDLAEALRAKGQLESRLRKAEEERDQLRSGKTTDNRAIREMTAERNTLRVKLRDKEEELRGKTKLLEDLQDEVLALNLQLNVAEQQKAKVQAENKQLVDRWMKRMGQEAEAMNLANEPLFAKRR
ncbi:putative autophagy protein 16 protein [Phaeoacremonium minimum UCRPA7]|uniref:Putative autophagy protein 16 protein n=1 Tax=Phaeoacremonium minimum (strain UCR-PA7) TaxID=1286976 RepID=R8BIG8_PHAM7|nr:putative autophagy protein 16 protein [Phaeoacremonium minimum UCRPA7]EON99106.1 putative autophagy protein 16 protein [Phaeoacremonium minimum UCRPA7]